MEISYCHAQTFESTIIHSGKKNGSTYKRKWKHIRPTKACIPESHDSDLCFSDSQEKMFLEQCKPSNNCNCSDEKSCMTRSERVMLMLAKYNDNEV